MARDVEPRKGGGLRLIDGVALVVVGVVGVVVLFAALSFVAGLAWTLIKLAILVAVVSLVVKFVAGRRRA